MVRALRHEDGTFSGVLQVDDAHDRLCVGARLRLAADVDAAASDAGPKALRHGEKEWEGVWAGWVDRWVGWVWWVGGFNRSIGWLEGGWFSWRGVDCLFGWQVL